MEILQLSYLMCIKTLPLDSIVNGGSGNEVSYLLEGSRAGNESKVLLLQVSFYQPTAAPKFPDSSKVYSNSVNSSGHPTCNPSEKHYQRQSLDGAYCDSCQVKPMLI